LDQRRRLDMERTTITSSSMHLIKN